MTTTFKREIFLRPAWDKSDPDPKKNYGIHGVDFYAIVTGPKGAISFVLATNWMLPHNQAKTDARLPERGKYGGSPYLFHKPFPTDLGYHAYEAQYEGQELMTHPCDYLEGKPRCFYDGSGLRAQEVFDALVVGGSDGMWAFLEKEYVERFETKDAEPTAREKIMILKDLLSDEEILR